ncbi:MAG: cupin domain-containing protein [Burkholderiales bacterium]|nr:cupin domain-containing protein [Burkholderiales bacterium]
MNTTRIQLFREQNTAAEFDHPRSDRLVNGNPQRTTWNHFTNRSGEMFVGVWASEVGSWRIEMGETEDEYFYVIEGSGAIIEENGERRSFTVGDVVIIPAGFKGIFEVSTPLKKHYVIVERQTA